MLFFTSIFHSFNNLIKTFLDYLIKAKDKQFDTDILKDKQYLKKASNISEDIINNTDNFFSWTANLCWDILSFKQRRQFVHFFKKHKKLKKQFEKVN
ncbi:hypothetical protein IJG14_06140 [bacterium]|nr:hypothetical protein [bacterium]